MHILPCLSKVECRRRKIEILWLALDWKMRLGVWVGWGGRGTPWLIQTDWTLLGWRGRIRFDVIMAKIQVSISAPSTLSLSSHCRTTWQMCPRTPFIFPRPVLNPSIHKPPNHYILVQDLALNPSWFVGPAQVYSLWPYSLELILKRSSTCPMHTPHLVRAIL